MVFRRYGRGRRPVKKGRRVYKKRTGYGKRTVAKSLSKKQKLEVKKLIHRQLENKIYTASGYMNAQPCGLGSSVGTLSTNQTFQISLSDLAQGVAENQRIGNRLRIMKAVMRCVLTMNPQTIGGTANSFVPGQYICKMFIGHTKAYPSGSVNSGNLSNLLRYNGSGNDFNSSLFSIIRPINSEYWTIKRQVTKKVGFANPSFENSGGQTYTYNVVTGVGNNDYKFSHIFTMDITNCFSKTIIYDESSSFPQNIFPTVILGVVDSAGSNINYSTTYPIRLTWECDITFEDA